MEKMLEKAKGIKGLKKTISTQAKIAGLKYHTEGEKEGMFKVFQKIYLSKVKSLLGFDQCTIFFTGAAPIEKKVKFKCFSLTLFNPFRHSTISYPWTSGLWRCTV